MNPTDSIIVFGIDPGTEVTGVALLEANPNKVLRVIAVAAAVTTKHHNDRVTARDWRINETGVMITNWLTNHPTVDAVGCEEPYFNPKFGQNNYATLGLLRACGHYMGLSILGDARRYDIAIATAKAVYKGAKLRREQAKPAVMAWARREWGLTISDDANGEAEADALSVAVATWGKWKEEWWKAAQTSLKIPRNAGKTSARKVAA